MDKDKQAKEVNHIKIGA